MATISGNVCNTYVHMDLVVTETATSTENNTSTVTWKLIGLNDAPFLEGRSTVSGDDAVLSVPMEMLFCVVFAKEYTVEPFMTTLIA